MALIKVDSPKAQDNLNFLRACKEAHQKTSDLEWLGPITAVVEKQDNRFRHFLIVQHTSRSKLQNAMKPLIVWLETQKTSSSLRWFIDIDPSELP